MWVRESLVLGYGSPGLVALWCVWAALTSTLSLSISVLCGHQLLQLELGAIVESSGALLSPDAILASDHYVGTHRTGDNDDITGFQTQIDTTVSGETDGVVNYWTVGRFMNNWVEFGRVPTILCLRHWVCEGESVTAVKHVILMVINLANYKRVLIK